MLVDVDFYAQLQYIELFRVPCAHGCTNKVLVPWPSRVVWLRNG
jgi:hypothetical protein